MSARTSSMKQESMSLVASSMTQTDANNNQVQYGTVTTDILDNDDSWPKMLSQKIFPTGFGFESKRICRLAWPVYLSDTLKHLTGIVSIIFCGHLGQIELDAVSLATSLVVVTDLSISAGLTTACDTLFSQAFGTSNKKAVGIYLQRSLMIVALASLPCMAVHLNTQQILLLIGQDAQVSRLAGEYMLIFLPAVLFIFIQSVLEKYLQNQGILKPLVYIGLLGNAINILLHYLFIYVLQVGVRGSAISQVASYLFTLTFTLFYIIISKKYKDTWPGWTRKAFENWGYFFKLGLNGIVMIAMEYWTFEIGVFLTGLLGTLELASISVLLQIQDLNYRVHFSLGISNSILIGHSLGSGKADVAKTVSRTSQVLALMLFILEAVLLFSLMSVLPFIFTSDVAVADLVTALTPILALVILFDSITSVSMGTLRGAGRQIVGAVVNIVGYVCITTPLFVVFMIVMKIGASGFLWAVLAGQIPASAIYLILIYRMNWKREVDKVATRILTNDVVSLEIGSNLLAKEPRAFSDDGDLLVKYDMHLSYSQHDLSEMYKINNNNDGETGDVTCHLVVKRLAVLFIMMLTFVAGVLTRVFIPVWDPHTSNSTIENRTYINANSSEIETG